MLMPAAGGSLQLLRRLLFTAFILGLAVMAAIQAADASLSRDDPEAALRLNPNDAVALVAHMDDGMAQLGAGGAQSLADAGRRALLASPLSAGGLRLIGLAADLRNDHRYARDLIVMSMRVSRRDLGAHVWMIEDRAAAGDIAGALGQYDLALSTSDQASALLFPLLTAALDSDQIRAGFMPLIGENRPWMVSFFTYAIANADDPRNIAQMMVARGGLPHDAAYQPLQALMLRQLVAKKYYAAAYRYALSLPGVKPQVLNDAAFTAETMDPKLAPLTWQLSEDSETRAVRGDDGHISALAAPSAHGVAAVRTLFLRPGTYQLTQTVAPLSDRDTATITWEVSCIAGGPAVLWQQTIPPVAAASRYRAAFTIPAQCPVQQFFLMVAGDDSQSDSGVDIARVHLGPIAQP